MDEKLKSLWRNNRLAFWLLVVPLGLAIVAYKFRSVLIDLLVNDSRKIAIETEQKDKELAQEQAAASAAAEELRKQAAALSKNKPTVGEDWNKS